VSIATSGGFADLDSDNVFGYSASGLPTGLSIDPDTGLITGTLNPDASQGGPGNDGVYSITVTATDSQGATISQTFTFTATNPAPVAQPDTGAVNEDATLTVSAANGVIQSGGVPAGLDSDVDGDALQVIGVTTGTAVSVAAVGTANVAGSLLGTYGHLTLNVMAVTAMSPTQPPPTPSVPVSPPPIPSATRSAMARAAPPSPH
jgi:hypothetical protein